MERKTITGSLVARRLFAVAVCVAVFADAWAGGSNYGVTPGTHPNLTGKVTEWPVPTPRFARDPAPGPDGNIYISVMTGKMIVDSGGRLWYMGSHNGRLGVIE